MRCGGQNDISQGVFWVGTGEAMNDKDKVGSGDKVVISWVGYSDTWWPVS